MGMLGLVLAHQGDTRSWTLSREALEMLEPLGPSPSLAAALAEVGVTETLRGELEGGRLHAERALTLAKELGLIRPARALGFRGLARTNLGDAGGLRDLREAIDLANEAGQGGEVALLNHNLGVALWGFEGPAASLDVTRDGLAYAKARGISAIVDAITVTMVDALVAIGEYEEALEVARDVAKRLEANGDVVDLAWTCAAQARVFAVRGQAERVVNSLEWLESTSRGTESPESIVSGLGASASVRADLGQDEATASLLTELEAFPHVRENVNYPVLLPEIVRTALRIRAPALAERLVDEVEPRYPYAEHALVAANAALAEASGNLQVAADVDADAADRWEQFGVVPEQAFAFLGQGRCLLGLSRPTEAAPILQHAREIFERLEAAPSLAETDALLEQATAARLRHSPTG